MTTIKIKLDIWHKNCVVVSASQGEVNSRFLEMTLVDGGVPLNLEGTTVLIYAKKPDGNVIFNNCTIENAEKGVVSVGLTSQMSALSGKLDCEIHVINREKSTLKLLGLQIRIASCADSDSAVESTSEFTVLSNAIEQTLEIMDQYSEGKIMDLIKSMDGEGSGLDADLLDGKHGSEYATKAQGTKADSSIQGIQGNGTTITKDASNVVNITPDNIGAAASSHGNHVPATQTADNKIFLRNDNTWQTVTPANIGAVPTTRTVNAKPLSSNITLTSSDVGAAARSHNHSTSEISSGIFPIERGGTNAVTAADALENLGGVPKIRTVNNKALSENILLTASDVGAAASNHGNHVPTTQTANNKIFLRNDNTWQTITPANIGAATTAQGTKADSAIQGVKVSGSLITPDANKTVNITGFKVTTTTATALNGCVFNQNEIRVSGNIVTINLLITAPAAFTITETTVCQLPAGTYPGTTQYFTCGISDGVWSVREIAQGFISIHGCILIQDFLNKGYKNCRIALTCVI